MFTLLYEQFLKTIPSVLFFFSDLGPLAVFSEEFVAKGAREFFFFSYQY